MDNAADRHSSLLSQFSLNRRVTVLVLFVSLLVVGMAAALRIPVELLPGGFNPPFLAVIVPYQDAPAQEILDKISVPLEEQLNTVKGVGEIVSVSSVGRSAVYMTFKQGIDLDVAYREVRDRVERAKLIFPDDVDRVFIRKEDMSGFPIFMVGVALDPDLTDQYNLIKNEIITPLERIDGVASVRADGLLEKEILIEVDRERMTGAGLNIWQLAQDLGSDNFTMASGTVYDGADKLLLRSVARFDDLAALENRMVGETTRLKDIAKISYEQPEKEFRVRAMSKPAVALMALKEGDANVRDVTGRLSAAIEEMRTNPRLADTDMEVFFSQGDIIDESLRTLITSGMIGGLIAALVLFLFLRRFRLTMIIALGIPLSMLIGLTAMYFFGESLNLLTLIGLMVCVGLLVDNSVVVAENIHRLYRDGMNRRDACIKGASEVGLAITMSTLTTIVVFLPVSLVGGMMQFFLLRLSIPICVSVASSLLVALVFIPLAVYLTLGSDHYIEKETLSLADRGKSILRRLYDMSFGKLNDSYGRLLSFFLTRRLELVVLVLALGATVPVSCQKGRVEFVGQQEEEKAAAEFSIEMPATNTLEETEAWFIQAEQLIEENAEDLDLDGWFHFHEKTEGEIQVWFKNPRTNNKKPKEISEALLALLPQRPDMKIFVGGRESVNNDKKNSVFPVRLNGDDPGQLRVVADEIEAMLLRQPGVLGATSDQAPAPNELALVVDRTRAQHFGANPEVIAGVVGYALRGTPLPKYRSEGREIPVRVRFEEADRESLAELADFQIPTSQPDVFLPLSALTQTTMLDAPEAIVRRDARVSKTVVVELEEGKEKETQARLGRMVAAYDLPEGVTLGANTIDMQTADDLAEIGAAILLSIVFIYLLMGFLFESFILPLSIVLTIPLSSMGVAWIHLITGYDVDFLGSVAIILLIGVVVNNGIVLIDYVNRLRREGMDRHDALLTATHRRFRPIMMTAITTIGGMVPLAFAGASSIGLSYTSFSLTLIGGMSTATLLTLLVIPIFYTLFDDLRTQFSRTITAAAAGFGKDAAPTGGAAASPGTMHQRD